MENIKCPKCKSDYVRSIIYKSENYNLTDNTRVRNSCINCHKIFITKLGDSIKGRN